MMADLSTIQLNARIKVFDLDLGKVNCAIAQFCLQAIAKLKDSHVNHDSAASAEQIVSNMSPALLLKLTNNTLSPVLQSKMKGAPH